MLDVPATILEEHGIPKFRKPIELARTTWAIGKIGGGNRPPWTAIWRGLAAQSIGMLDQFNAQDLANTVWAFATAGHVSPALCDAVEKEAVHGGLREFTPQALANTVWAFAKAEQPAQALFAAVAKAVVAKAAEDPRLGEFKPQNLANTAWAFAMADESDKLLFAAFARAAERSVGEFDA